MKLTTNLIATPDRCHRLPMTACWGLAGALAAAAALLVVDMRQAGDDLPDLRARLAQLNAQHAATEPVDLPATTELHAMQQRVAALNGLDAHRGFAASEFLAWLEARLPDDVRLTSLSHRPRSGEAVLVAESSQAASLTTFLLRLEDDPRVAEVTLSRQSGRAEANPGGQVEVRLRFRP